jgi:hypothetical protein
MASTITAGNATNSGLIVSPDNTGALEIKTGSGAGTTAVTVDSSQNVGIGTSSTSNFRFNVNGQGNFSTGANDFITVLSDSGAMEICRSTGDAYIDFKNSGAEDFDCRIQSIGTSGTFSFSTAGGERMRIGPSGQIGLSGANYGTSGQVLTSQGSGSAPVWGSAPAPSTTDVLNATAGLTAGAVGTYGILLRNAATAYGVGSTIAGSLLLWSNATASGASGAPSGTWRHVGNMNATTAVTSVWIRIS